MLVAGNEDEKILLLLGSGVKVKQRSEADKRGLSLPRKAKCEKKCKSSPFRACIPQYFSRVSTSALVCLRRGDRARHVHCASNTESSIDVQKPSFRISTPKTLALAAAYASRRGLADRT